MKIVLTLVFFFAAFTLSAQTVGKFDAKQKTFTAEASCGKCKLGLKGKTCELAVRIDGKSYYVDGASIDNFGDAHSDDGFCNTIRQAKVQGKIVNGRFKATYFEVLPAKKENADKSK